MTTQEIIGAIGLIGIGGLLKSLIDYLIEGRKKRTEAQHQFKETRFKPIILLLNSLAHYDREKDKLVRHRPDLKTKEDLVNELKTEWTNMILFASDNVIETMRDFIEEPNENNFNRTILAMRTDLYGLKSVSS
jgi:hypothetical protein